MTHRTEFIGGPLDGLIHFVATFPSQGATIWHRTTSGRIRYQYQFSGCRWWLVCVESKVKP